MKTLNKTDIFKAKDHKQEIVSVPEWGGHVWVKSLTGAERDAFEQSIVSGNGRDKKMNLTNLRARLCVLTAVAEDGSLLFTATDIAALSQKNAAALDRLFCVAQKLSGIGADELEELVGNSDGGLSDSLASN